MTYYWRLMAILLVATLGVTACNDDTSSSPTGPQDDEQPVAGDDGEPANSEGDEATVFFGELNQAMTSVIPMLLIGGGELAENGGGRVVVEGTTMTLEDYSPDGETAMTGVIVIEILESLWHINGALTFSGANEGEVVVAMTLNPLSDPPPQGESSPWTALNMTWPSFRRRTQRAEGWA